MQWAVLTGDIVDSSDLSSGQLDDVMSALQAVARDLGAWPAPQNPAPQAAFARRGGDGWQIALNRPEFALRACLFIIARLRARPAPVATRIAVATGSGTLPKSPQLDLNSAHGDAFTGSGRLLSTLTKRRHLAHASGGALDAVFRLADHITQGWTAPQAQAVCLMLPPGSGPRRIAAEKLGITRQAVDQALHAAGFPALEQALKLIEADHA